MTYHRLNPDTDTTYSAGTGLALSGTTFRTTIPRIVKSANSLPGQDTVIFEEYTAGSNYNLPSNAWYHIITMEGEDTKYATQLALGMTTDGLYFRRYSNSSWTGWLKSSTDGHTHSYLPLSGGTLTGGVNLKSTSINRDAANPSSDQWGSALILTDADNERIGIIEVCRHADGSISNYFRSYTEDTSGNQINNTLELRAYRNGSRGVGVSDAGAWRSALNAVNKSGDTMTGLLNINTNGTTLTIGAANSGWTHFSSSANRQFYFNRTISVDGDFLIYNTNYAMLRTLTNGDRINYMARGNDYLHVTTWNYGDKGVTWWNSDIRLKENIEDSEVDALGLVNAIPHRSFDMKRDGAHHDIGYIAQELEELDESLVMKVYQTRDVNGTSYFTGDYSYQIDERKVIPYLSRAIQQLSDENDELRRKNAELESRLERIEKELGL